MVKPDIALAWSSQQPIAGNGTTGNPAMAVFNGELYAMWKGVNGDDNLYWATSNGTTWSAAQEITGASSGTGPSLAVFNGRLYATWQSSNDSIYWANTTGSAWSDIQLITNRGSSAAPALAVLNGRLFALWKGTGNDQGLYWSSPATGPAGPASRRSATAAPATGRP